TRSVVLVIARQEVRRKQAADHEQEEQQQPRPDLRDRRTPRWHVPVLLDDGRARCFLVDPPCAARSSLAKWHLSRLFAASWGAPNATVHLSGDAPLGEFADNESRRNGVLRH